MKDVGKIKDACLVIAGQSPQGSSYNEDGIGVEFHQGKKAFGDSIIEPSGVWTTEPSKIAEAGDILMSVRAPVGPTNVTDRKICIGRGLAAIRCKDGFMPQYILYSLRNIESKIIGNDGAIFNSINKTQIEDLPLPLLSPKDQQSIVEYLDSSFAKIDAMKANAEKALDEAKALFQASLKSLLEPKDGWTEKKIKDLGTVVAGTTPNTNIPEYWDGDLCWISPAELDGSHYLYDSKKKITEAGAKAKSLKLLPVGTVILSSRAPIGKVVINKIPTYCNQDFKCVICGDSIYNEFLYWWFWWKTDYLNALGTGATFKEISKTVVENITISVPSVDTQKAIADSLESLYAKVAQLQANYDKISAECDALKQALLKQVFE